MKYKMVHGDYFGINYFIYLTKPLDFFDDVLPICSSSRHMLTLINPTKISIFKSTNFDKRLNAEEFSSFISSFYELQSRCYGTTNALKNRHLFPEMYLYNDVLLYSNTLKGKSLISNEELDIMKTRYNELVNNRNDDNYDINMYKLFSDELKSLHHNIEIQTILGDAEYLQKVIDMETNLTTISLTEEEIRTIKSIESHATLHEIILTSGFEIVKEYS